MKKRRKLKKWVYYVFIFFFLGLMIYSLINVIAWYNDSKKTKELNEAIIENTKIIDKEDTSETEYVNYDTKNDSDYFKYIKMSLLEVDFTDLVNKNKDTVAWIQVGGTNINYPVVQTNNNEDYLKKAYDGSYNEAGWVFMDYRNNVNTFDQNTIIYAHSRVDGTMFGSLKNILNTDWYQNKDNHIIKLSTKKENTLWQVFSVYTIEKESYYITPNFDDEKEYTDFLNTIKQRSEKDFSGSVNAKDKVLTLSTCKDNSGNRIVMHAKLIKKEKRA